MTITPRPEQMLETMYAVGRERGFMGQEVIGRYFGGGGGIIRDRAGRGIPRGQGRGPTT
jgi:hypothetical protein